jgi:anti-anti-sigma factor
MPNDSPDAFAIERHGDVMVIVALPALGSLDVSLIEGASALILQPIEQSSQPNIVFDLAQIDYFGSTMLVLLIRCYKAATAKGGQMVLAGPDEVVRHQLHLTSMDTVWPIYETRTEAIEALSSD